MGGFVCIVRQWEEIGVSQAPTALTLLFCAAKKSLLSKRLLDVSACNDETILHNTMGSTCKQTHLEIITVINMCTKNSKSDSRRKSPESDPLVFVK